MPIYAEGFRHQRQCPHEAVEKSRLGANGPGETSSAGSDTESVSSIADHKDERKDEAKKICKDTRCCTWFDLANWFGYLPLALPPGDFEACFTDVAHGGTG